MSCFCPPADSGCQFICLGVNAPDSSGTNSSLMLVVASAQIRRAPARI